MLDDLKLIHERDAQDLLGVAERQYAQLAYEFADVQPKLDVDNIVYAALGGSAIAAELSLSWPGHQKPFQIVRGYDIPDYVSERTYFIASSYSGNTEETLSAIAQAEARGAKIAIITHGGQMADVARAKNYPLLLLPDAGHPRFAVLYNFRALCALLTQAGLLDASAGQELAEQADFFKKTAQNWQVTVPTAQNLAKQIALEVIGKSAVIYTGPKLAPVAYKWKIGFNENAKHLAWTNQFPEFNHNEFTGWAQQPTQKPYAVIDLRSTLEHPRVQEWFVLTERLLSGMRPAPIVVDVQGENLLQQLLWAFALGDFVTLYTALLNGVNPAPVELVEKFKRSLSA